MSGTSTSNMSPDSLIRAERFHNVFQIQHLPLLHPKFCIKRPNGQMVPLIAMDELPHWLLVVTKYPITLNDMEVVAPNRQVPRAGEYDIICLFCESTLEHVADDISWQRSKMKDLDQYKDSLIGRRYPPYVYPSSYYEDARSLHHYDTLAMSRAMYYDPGRTALNPEARVFRPSAGGANPMSPKAFALPYPIRSDDARSSTREIQMIIQQPCYRHVYIVQPHDNRYSPQPRMGIPWQP